MNDPYKVLGIQPDASDDEVKKAYRAMAKKYHPDNYQDNPLADLAQEKMKEINEAYDTITKMRAGGSSSRSGGYSGGSYSGSSSYSGNAIYTRIRAALSSGNIQEAEQLLSTVSSRDAEWNFLMGSLYFKKGWMDDARTYYQYAVQMDPSNAEYQRALMMVGSCGTPYRSAGYGTPSVASDMCDMCTAMMCMNLMCGGCR